MWFTLVTARLFIFLSFQPHLTAALSRSCPAVNSPTRQAGLAPAFQPASLAQRRVGEGKRADYTDRSCWFRGFPSPLIEPNGRVSHIRLSEPIHRAAADLSVVGS
jgi:hypothetical protein